MLIGSTQAIKRPKGVERVLSVLKKIGWFYKKNYGFFGY
jgi:hypothetical protein